MRQSLPQVPTAEAPGSNGRLPKPARRRLSPLGDDPLDVPGDLDADHVRLMVERARVPQPGWAATPVRQRAAALQRAGKAMLADRHRAIGLLRKEAGKLEVDALMGEVLGCLDQINGWARVVDKGMKPRRVMLNPVAFMGKSAVVKRRPRGVIGCITPWNYPIATFFRPVLPALLAGNAVLVKPSEYTLESANWFLGHLAKELPTGLVQVVQGGAGSGEALIDGGIDALTFTGSVNTGRKVLEQAAQHLIPVSLELGGNDPALVLPDCDLPRTVAGITHWKLHNAGQACGAVEVALVHEDVADRFVRELADAWKRLKVGPQATGFGDISPLSHEGQQEIVATQVREALDAGATLVCGGEPGEHLAYQPTILDHCREDMSVVREETFGPVLAVVRVGGTEEAVQIANRLKYGLTASVWSKDLERARRLADRLDFGTVTINNHSVTGAMVDLPWSGRRQSGFGIANGPEALNIFTHPVSVLTDSNDGPDPYWMPFDEKLYEMGSLLADAMVGKVGKAWKIPILMQQRIRTIKKFFNF